MGVVAGLLLATLLLGATPCVPAQSAPLKTFAFEDLFPYLAEFYPKGIDGRWISATEYVYRYGDDWTGLKKYNLDTNTTEQFLNETQFNSLDYSIADIYKDGDNIRIVSVSEVQLMKRYTFNAIYTIYDLATGTKYKLAGGALLQTAVFDETERPALAYVRENNVYYVPDVARPDAAVQLTADGVPGVVFHGAPDYVYQEEIFYSKDALWFSPNGTYLAVATINNTLVDSYPLVYYGDSSSDESQYPTVEYYKYPKVGRTNPTVSVKVYPVACSGLEYEAIDIPTPVDIVGEDNILGRVEWADDQNVVVFWLNRRQNTSVLVKCNVETVACDYVRVQTEENGWIDITDEFFDSTGTKMIDTTPSLDNSYTHAILRDLTNNATTDLTPGNLTVLSIIDWDLDSNILYYIAVPQETPWERQLWARSESGQTCLTCSVSTCGTVESADFSDQFKYAMIVCSRENVPFHHYFYNVETKTFTMFEDNSELSELLSEYDLPTSKFETVTLENGSPANIELIYPPQFDESSSYPLVLKFNSGPGEHEVRDSYVIDLYSYLAANRSYIVAKIDTRGSLFLGTQAYFGINQQIGITDIYDSLNATSYLLKTYSYIDSERVGSYDARSLDLLVADGSVVKCAAVASPIINPIYYDSMYTERYMGLRTENQAEYDASNLLLKTEKFRGKKFAILHGTFNDNFHVQSSLLLAKNLQQADIQFSQHIYTDEGHGLYGAHRHEIHSTEALFAECFA